MNRQKLHRLVIFGHVIFAGFFLPAAIVFAITGGLYTFGIKGNYHTETLTKELPIGSDPGLEQLTSLARTLVEDDFKGTLPSGAPAIRKLGTSWGFDWSGVRAELSIEPTEIPGSYKIAYKKTDAHRFFVQLHKAKGGFLFKLMAGGLAIGFVMLFLSGVTLALLNRQRTRWLQLSLALGVITFIVAAALS